MAEIKQTISELEDTFIRITKIRDNIKKCPKTRLTRGYLETKLQCLEDYWCSYKTVNGKLLKMVPRDERKQLDYFSHDIYGTCEDNYTETKANILDLIKPGEAKLLSPKESVLPQVKLPKIQLPTFSGNYEDWPTYKDLFNSLVHENSSLSKVQKLHYLKLSVTDEAGTLLKHIQVTEANYDQARKMLINRFDNKRLIIASILKRMFNQKKMQNQTANHIKSLLDTTVECLNNLKNQEIDVNSWDPIVIFLLVQKLDSESHKEWEEYASKNHENELPSFATLKKFLETKFRTLELISSKERPAVRSSYHASTTSEFKCPMCNDNHALCHCKEFGKIDPSQRSNFVRNNSICFNCLVPGHAVKSCRLSTSCRICRRRHHTLLHEPRLTNNVGGSSQDIEQPHVLHCNEEEIDDVQVNTVMTSRNSTTAKTSTALLATAVVIVKNKEGYSTILRALVDPGSQGCLITEKAAQILKCTRHSIKGTILGVGSTSSRVKHFVHVEILSRCQTDCNLKIKAYVISKQLTAQIPTQTLPSQSWSHLRGLTLADSEYHTPGPIDLLLGVDEYAQILQNDVIKGPPGSPCAQKTTLGWILFGNVYNDVSLDQSIVVMHQQIEVDDLLKILWEQDIDNKRKLTEEEETCEKIYTDTYTRNKDGRYVVNLPLKIKPPRAVKGNTRSIALKRLIELKRKLERNPKLKESYTKVLTEYLQLGHMEEVPGHESENVAVYLPHHAVVREDKETSKVRVVFDASSKGLTGVSLNDDLMTGPLLQEDLRSIILRWRKHKICFTGDIEKMYRMILVRKEHADFQRILWYENDLVKEYRLLTVTFGTTAAPYLAVKTLKQIAADEGENYTVASKILNEDFYVDDVMSGFDSVEEAIEACKQLQTILEKGGMTLKKWSSNSLEFLKSINPELVSTNAKFNITIDGTVKALGLSWNLKEDNFHYSLNFPPMPKNITKRTILADLQRLFDPLGWIAPAVVSAKMLIQQLWLEGVKWDDKIEDRLEKRWIAIREDLINVERVKVNRWLNTYQLANDKLSLHGFCDASKHAIAAVVYSRVENPDGSFMVSIVAARTKVAPIKPVTLPRLELCGAVLLAKLLHHVAKAMRVSPSQTYAWTDSSVALAWLFGEPSRWKPFVANRVVEILEYINNNQWHHVRSEHNPADVASRGSTISELLKNTLWWQGPEWLSHKRLEFNKPNAATDLEQKKTINIFLTINTEENKIKPIINIESFESLTELKNVITYCRRFLHSKKWPHVDKALTVEELDKSLKIFLRRAQTEDFMEEIKRLKERKAVKQKSFLKSLNPYLDEENLLRVGGRLRHANLSAENKNPIILSKNNPLTLLIVADAHRNTLHGGLQLMLSYLRTRYWIIKAKSAVKNHIHKCIVCAKIRAKSINQIMGDLPKVRVSPARAFLHSGVDFAGPYNILMSRGRGMRTIKSYIAIFICMCTKAIHIELVGDLTSQSFIAAFRRFVARRGRCLHLWSDQGRNFVGANKELVDTWIEARLNFKNDIANLLVQDGTQWHFVPPYSPNFGGLWEAGVKSIKFHLKRILTTTLTYEELSTVLCQVEACLNSRPLCPIDDEDVENVNPLTPAHFLIGEPTVIVPSPDLRQVTVNHLARWQYLQKLVADFWHKWRDEYLTRLQQRPKWIKERTEFDVGDIVLVKQDNVPPGKWLMGRIIAKHPGLDTRTRVYSVKIGETITKRCVTKLCHLPINSSSD